MPWDNQLVNNLDAQNQKGQFIVASVTKNTNEMSVSNHPKIHGSAYDAGQEASRLASMSKNKKFVVLQVVSVHTVTEVEVTSHL